jgi:toxin ParE1/3/4
MNARRLRAPRPPRSAASSQPTNRCGLCGRSTAYEAALHASCLADLTSILDYVADRTPKGAARIHSRIRDVMDVILRYPLAGAATDDPTIRRIATAPYPYLIYYETTDA